jgi:uncharacterized protein YndB with AHSA1/START domain
MKDFHGRATTHVDAPADTVFALLTDVARLPEWNAAIEAVVDDPGPLTPGTEWTVTMHPARLPRWGSMSHLERIDHEALELAYRTRNTDGNPSWVDWAWTATPTGDGCEVTVEWTCHLETLDRRFLAGPMRKRQLAREVPRSLEALARTVAPAGAA